jgi:Flp pilus assembly protein TadD
MDNYKLRYLAAHNHWKKASFESATVHFQTAISAKPESPNAYIDLALLKIHERNYFYAERVLQNAIYQLTQYKVEIPSKLYNIYTRLELLKGFPQKALNYAQSSKAAFSQSGTGIKDKLEAVTLEARAHLLLENFDKAELAAQWAITLKEKNVYAYNLLGYIYSSWSKKVAAENPEKSKELKELALENFNIALKSSNLVDEYKTIIESNILNLN